MGKTAPFRQMSYAALVALRSEIDERLSRKKIEEKADLKRRFAEVSQERGFHVNEVFGRRNFRKVPPKYQDPTDPWNTWTGRGRKPRWVVEALKGKGRKLEDFLILK